MVACTQGWRYFALFLNSPDVFCLTLLLTTCTLNVARLKMKVSVQMNRFLQLSLSQSFLGNSCHPQTSVAELLHPAA